MNRLATLACLAISLTGCNAILGIERASVVSHDRDAETAPDAEIDAAPCGDDACAPPSTCSTNEECTPGDICTDGLCLSPDAGTRMGAEDANSDAPPGDGGSDAGCSEGEFRCEGAALPTRLQCVAGIWKSGAGCASGQLCDSQSTPPGACKAVVDVCLGQRPNQGFCVGAERVVCGPDLVSATRKDCVESALCNLGTGGECAPCNRNDAKCEGDDLHLCTSDYSGFAFSEKCNAGECRANLGRCTSMLCNRDAWSCNGKILEHCNATGTAYIETDRKDCGTGICDEFSGKCKACEANANLGCVPASTTHQLLCDPDGEKTIMRPCAELSSATPTCVGAGVCVQCAPDSKTCRDATTAITCSGQGVSTPGTCTGTTCVTGKGCSGECAPDTYKCVGKAMAGRMKCGSEGLFNESETCGPNSNCDSATGQCKPIVEGCAGQAEGTVLCVGSKRVTCGADLVNAVVDQCGSLELCNLGTGGKCAACTDTTYDCRVAELWTCNAGHTALEKKETCATEALCNEALGRCTDQKCEANKWYCTTDGTNTLRQCNQTGSDYLPGTPCGSKICDAVGMQCDDCRGGDLAGCSSNNRLRCNPNGQGTTPEACTTPTPVCAGSGTSATCVQCMPNSDACSSDFRTALHCNNLGTQTSETCTNPARTCSGGQCTGVCSPGQYQCGTPGTATRSACGPAGTFSVAANCASNEVCEASTGRCVAPHTACTNPSSGGQWVCSGRNRVQCSADRLTITTGSLCESTTLCEASSGNTCAQCVTGQSTDRCNQGQPETCTGNTWVKKGNACLTVALCNVNTGTCGTAACSPPNSWSCTSNHRGRQHCNVDATAIDQTVSCPWCLDSNPSVCATCEPDTFATDGCFNGGTQRKKCSASATWTGDNCPNAGWFCSGLNQCVQCTADSCASNAILNDCSPTGTLAQVNCSPSQTCFTDTSGPHCGGNCRESEYTCMSGNSFLCSSTGAYNQFQVCTPTGTQATRCDLDGSRASNSNYGKCVPNPLVYEGNTGATGTAYPMFDMDIIAQPFVPTAAIRVIRLGLRTLQGNDSEGVPHSGGGVYLFLYSDNNGQPGNILARVPFLSLIADSTNMGGLGAGPFTLTANTRYWIVGVVNASPSSTVRVYQSSVSSAGHFRRGRVPNFDERDPLPVNATNATTGGRISLLAEMRRF